MNPLRRAPFLERERGQLIIVRISLRTFRREGHSNQPVLCVSPVPYWTGESSAGELQRLHPPSAQLAHRHKRRNLRRAVEMSETIGASGLGAVSVCHRMQRRKV